LNTYPTFGEIFWIRVTKVQLSIKHTDMAKAQDAKKAEKKEPLKTPKEKKAEKREKKEKKSYQ